MDDSIHDQLGFMVLAFVFSSDDLDSAIREALGAAGLDPEKEEFKSGTRMDHHPAMQSARSNLARAITKHGRVGVVVARRHEVVPMGKQCLQALQSILIRNGISPDGLSVYVDEGIFRSPQEAENLHALFRWLSSVALFSSEQSHRRRGIQAADLVAHTFSQVIREGITGSPKLVDAGGPDAGYPEGTMMPLSEVLVASLRYNILARRMSDARQDYDLATDPVIVGPDDDPVTYGQYPEAVGWGIHLSQELPDSVRQAVFRMLDRVWLGCIH